MARNWIEFDEGPAKTYGGIYVTMNRSGEIVMNRQTFEELDQPESVVMLFDPSTDTIGIRPASPLTPNAFPLKVKGTSKHQVIRAKPFAKKHDIKLDGTVRFRTAAVEDGVLVLDLRKMSNARRTKSPTTGNAG